MLHARNLDLKASITIDRDQTIRLPLRLKQGKLTIEEIDVNSVQEPEAAALIKYVKERCVFKRKTDGTVIHFPYNITKEETLELWFNNEKTLVATIAVKPENLVVHQREIQRLIPTEIRMSLTNTHTKQGSVPDEKSLYYPKTDLHTHYTAIMTADILIDGLRKKQTMQKPVMYPVKYLLDNGIDLSIYFNDVAEYKKFIDEYKVKKDLLFDITKFVDPKNTAKEKNKNNLAKLWNMMHIPRDKTIIFREMERFYDYRDVLVKDIELFPFFLEKIAQDYQKQGIKYVEISISKCIDPQWLKIMHDQTPLLQKKYGVKIRYLSSIARVVSKEKRDSQVKLFQQVAAKCPYVIGVDLLAAEVNSTIDMMPHLEDIARWANTYFPGMVLRVHAGEFAYHPENVGAVIELAEKYPHHIWRIGHGVHGGHSDVLEKLRTLINVWPEINMASNQALNSLGDIAKHTVFTYTNKGISVFLGSDGHGLYQTTNKDLIKLLTYAEPGTIDLLKFCQQLETTETNYITYANTVMIGRMKYFKQYVINALKELPSKKPEPGLSAYGDLARKVVEKHKTQSSTNMSYEEIAEAVFELAQDTTIKYTPETSYFEAAWNQMHKGFKDLKAACDAAEKAGCIEQAQKDKKLRDALDQFCNQHKIKFQHINLQHGSDEKEHCHHDNAAEAAEPTTIQFANKTPIMLTGMIFNQADKIEKIKDLYAFIKMMLEFVDPKKVFFVSTGKDIGVQKILHELVYQHNQKYVASPEKQFVMIGYIPANSKVDEMSSKLTHVGIVDDVSSIYALYEFVAKMLEMKKMRIITVGGSMWNKDLIQIADNVLRNPYAPNGANQERQLFLVKDVEGASKDKAAELPKVYSALADYSHILMACFGNKLFLSNQNIPSLQKRYKELRSTITVSDAELEKLQGRVLITTIPEIANIIIDAILSKKSCNGIAAYNYLDIISPLMNKKGIEELILKCVNNEKITDSSIYKRMLELMSNAKNHAAVIIFAQRFKILANWFNIKVPKELDDIAKKEIVKPEKQLCPVATHLAAFFSRTIIINVQASAPKPAEPQTMLAAHKKPSLSISVISD